MPNRVDANTSGVRPTVARADEQQADQAAQAPRAADAQRANATANQVDRVEISEASQARNQELAAADSGGETQRGAALNAPGAQGAQPDTAVGGTTAERAAELRERQDAARQQDAARPPERQGNLVDVTG